MKIHQYLDSTYLKTSSDANLSENENLDKNKFFIQEANENEFKLIMIRPSMVSLAHEMIQKSNSKVLIGTVIDFPLGGKSTEDKIIEAQTAIKNKVDELDFVLDYELFKKGATDYLKNQIYECTKLGLEHNKIVKWIIEVAALNDSQIIQICTLVKNCIISHFKETDYEKVFVKSSTGFYKTQNNEPNGATMHTIKIMLENAFPLPVKAAGGVRNYDEALAMIKLGVKRIGTSSAKEIVEGNHTASIY